MSYNKTSKNKANKNPTNHKPIRPPRIFDYTKGFAKDWARLTHAGRYDLNRLKSLMLLLIENQQPLAKEWLDYALKGEWSGHRECHIGGDFLLIYKIYSSNHGEQIIFVRAGTHAELFE